MLNNLACLCLAVVGAASSPAQTTGQVPAAPGRATLAGLVTTETGSPLEGVVVEVEASPIRAVTDGRGRYQLRGLPDGPVTVRYRLIGWGERSETVRVSGVRASRLDVQLAVDPVQLASVQVSSDRGRLVGGAARWLGMPGAAHVVDREALRREQRLFDDVHAALRQVPGVNVQDEEGYGLRANIGIRGTGVERSSKVAVLEDGVLAAPAPYSAPAAYYFPVVGRMDAVEVRKGSSQIEYGPWTTGGAVNLVSATMPSGFALDADVSGGSDATRRLHARVGDMRAGGRFAYVAETYQVETNGFKRLDGGGDTGFDIRDFLVKVRGGTDPSGALPQELELKLGYTDEESNETYLGLSDAAFAANALRRYAASQVDVMNAEHRQYQLRHVLRPSQRLDLTTTAYRNEFGRNWYKLQSVAGRSPSAVLGDPSTYAEELEILQGASSEDDALQVRANNRQYYAQGVQTVLGARFGDAAAPHDFALGIRWHRDEEDRFQHDDGYRMSEGRMVRTTQGAPGSQDNRVGEAEAWAGFASLRLRFGRWNVSPGVRFESIRFTRTDYERGDAVRSTPSGVRENAVDVWVPGIGFAGEVARSVSVFGGVHKGFGPPGPGANADTRAEESINYEFGARVLRGDAMLQATAFYNDYRNILGRATLSSGESGTGDLFNGGDVDVKGVELSAEYDPFTLGGVRFPVRLAYTYTDARFGNAFESDFDEWGDVKEGDRLPYLPVHQASAGVRAASDRWSAGLSVTGATAMRTEAGSGPLPPGTGTDAHVVLGASGEYRATEQATLYAGVQNLLDERYIVARRPAGARPGLPRTIAIGLRMQVR
jgi:Fe(3+) dicitrate transport protein